MWLLLRLWPDTKAPLRVLCTIVVAGWILSLLGYVLLVAAMFAPRMMTPIVWWLISPPVLYIAIAAFFVIVASNLLLSVVRCARCSKPLFSDSLQPFSYRPQFDIRHHRAKIFMNSYRRGAILELARTGRVSCSWCGHELGTKPEYVVAASE